MSFPSRDYQDAEGKKKFWPHMKYRNKETNDRFFAEALKEIMKKAEAFQPQPGFQTPPDDEIPF